MDLELMTEVLEEKINKCEGLIESLGFELPNNLKYEINGRLSTTHGRCMRSRSSPIDWRIQVNRRFLWGCINEDRLDLLKYTLLHEMYHALPRGFNHGEGWKQYTKAIDKAYGYEITERLDVPPEILKYSIPNGVLLECTRCDNRTLLRPNSRVAKFPELYLCGGGV